MGKGIEWADAVAPHDYDAALSYLALRLDPDRAARAVAALRRAPLSQRRAGDILRACRLTPAKDNDPGVQHEAHRAAKGKQTSPILVVSFGSGADIADGYHRTSLVYWTEGPFGEVPCKVAYVPELEHPA